MGMDIAGIGNKEAYFRANVWSWRPIHVIIDFVTEKYTLGINTESFGFNDGAGVKRNELCIKLADGIKAEMEQFGLKDKEDRIYIAIGSSWVTYPEGQFVTEKVVKENNLSEMSGILLHAPVASPSGLVVPSYSLTKEHLDEFCKFLRVCQGFEIW